MDKEYNDICKKMEAKGYEYIQEISAYSVDHTSVAGSITGHIFGEEGGFALFGKKWETSLSYEYVEQNMNTK